MPETVPEKPERIALQQPTVSAPDTPVVQEHLHCCGNCIAWHRTNPLGAFGQCLVAIRYLGAPMYTPDLANCSLDEEAKQNALQRR